MKKLLFILLFIIIIFNSHSQEYGKKIIYNDFGTWSLDLDSNKKILIDAFVTRQDITSVENGEMKKNTILILPKYRYELILISRSTINNIRTSTWLYGTRVFINGVEVTREQFPNGFTASIGVNSTLVYWYETISRDIEFKIIWNKTIIEPRIR